MSGAAFVADSDGHHCSRIADDLGVAVPQRNVVVRDDQHAREVAVEANTVRRHMSAEQRRAVVAELRQAGHSLRRIAGAVGTSLNTVQRDVGSAGVLGGFGESQPAHWRNPSGDGPR